MCNGSNVFVALMGIWAKFWSTRRHMLTDVNCIFKDDVDLPSWQPIYRYKEQRSQESSSIRQLHHGVCDVYTVHTNV